MQRLKPDNPSSFPVLAFGAKSTGFVIANASIRKETAMRFTPLSGRASLLALAACLATSASPARAAYIVTFSQLGPNVVASGSGNIDSPG